MNDADPDLLDYDGPNTGRIALDPAMSSSAVESLVRVVDGLVRWAKRMNGERLTVRSLIVRSVAVIFMGLLGVMGTVAMVGVYIGVRLERLDDVQRRMGRLEATVYSIDATTSASE